MDEQLLNEALRGLLDTFKDSKDFVLEQAPDVVQQLILYKTVYHGSVVLGGMLLMLLGAYLLYRGIKLGQESKWSDEMATPVIIQALFGFVGGLTGIIAFSNNIQIFMKVWLAPKVYLLEYISSLIK